MSTRKYPQTRRGMERRIELLKAALREVLALDSDPHVPAVWERARRVLDAVEG